MLHQKHQKKMIWRKLQLLFFMCENKTAHVALESELPIAMSTQQHHDHHQQQQNQND